MKFSDETLSAYADGALDPATRSAVERAIRADPTLAAKVRQRTAMRSNVFTPFSSTDQPSAPRPASQSRTGKVIQLNTARIQRSEPTQEKRRWSWPEWGAIGAALLVGVLAGVAAVIGVLEQPQLAAGANGALLAQGELDTALSTQQAGVAAPGSLVRIGVSFESKDGGYCRSFMMGTAAGLACRSGTEWRVPVMAPAAAAGNVMPPLVLDAINARIAGQTLDPRAEDAARQRGWKR